MICGLGGGYPVTVEYYLVVILLCETETFKSRQGTTAAVLVALFKKFFRIDDSKKFCLGTAKISSY